MTEFEKQIRLAHTKMEPDPKTHCPSCGVEWDVGKGVGAYYRKYLDWRRTCIICKSCGSEYKNTMIGLVTLQ